MPAERARNSPPNGTFQVDRLARSLSRSSRSSISKNPGCPRMLCSESIKPMESEMVPIYQVFRTVQVPSGGSETSIRSEVRRSETAMPLARSGRRGSGRRDLLFLKPSASHADLMNNSSEPQALPVERIDDEVVGWPFPSPVIDLYAEFMVLMGLVSVFIQRLRKCRLATDAGLAEAEIRLRGHCRRHDPPGFSVPWLQRAASARALLSARSKAAKGCSLCGV